MTSTFSFSGRLMALAVVLPGFLRADPLLTSWFAAPSAKYARIYTSDANLLAGNSVTTWSNGTQVQSLPAYCGVQEISYSASYVYVRTSGLAGHVMGPWYLNAARTAVFPNLPRNQNAIHRFPRVPSVPGTRTLTGLGAIGCFVDGVAMFDTRDGFVWNGTAEAGNGAGYWNRDAYVNEGVTFDPGYAHQENTGTHHYHANPIALRHQLGDHVDFDATTKTYRESTGPVTRHSPILGWVRDGFPIYGPYGYSSALDAQSGVRRMISGYVLRDGSNGTDDLASTGRASLPQWAVRAYNVPAGQTGPAVSGTYPLGRYMEDNAYLADLGRTQGVDFDLDEYNGRYCVTPEYPSGTYAYFVAIDAGGAPVFPYNIGRAFYGSPGGGTVTSIGEPVTVHSRTGPETQEVMAAPVVSSGDVLLSWSSVEGGTYTMEASTDLATWTPLSSTIAAASGAVRTTVLEPGAAALNSRRFYRVSRTALADYDGATSAAASYAPGGSASRGSTVTVTITLPGTPMNPPPGVGVTSVTLAGSIAGASVSRPTQGTVLATFAIPANAATGAQNIVVVFPGPTYTLAGGFTIN